ncbi:replication endonuclease, partial [Escherichia coli]|nr:replication endonuclease [Escherichia coli]
MSFAYPWNEPRSAIASPYLTHPQLQRRDRLFSALQQARKALALQPDCVRFDVWRTVDALELHQGSLRANAFLIRFCNRVLPRLQQVSARYACSGVDRNVSTAVFGGHFDTPLSQYLASRMVTLIARFNRLPDMS